MQKSFCLLGDKMISKVDVLINEIDKLIKELNTHFEIGFFYLDVDDGEGNDDDQ